MFVGGVLLAVGALVLAVVLTRTPLAAELALPVSPILVAWIGGVLVLCATGLATKLRSRSFDIAVASEVVVVYGIATLVLSIAQGVFRIYPIWSGEGGVTLQDLEPVLETFGEGLVAAGFSPLLAVGLRLMDAFGADGAPSTAAADPSAAAASLTAALSRAAASASSYADALETARRGAESAAGSLPASLHTAARKVEDAAAHIAAGAGRAGGGLADLGAKAETAARGMAEGATELTKLGPKAREMSELLDGLRDLIAQIDRFIRDHGGRDAA